MSEILEVIRLYRGNGFVLFLYLAALCFLLVFEKDKRTRVLFGYMPLLLLVLFVLPPFHGLYCRVEGAQTYYRLLWLAPMAATIAACAAKLCEKAAGEDGLRGLTAVLVILVAVTAAVGDYTYDSVHITPSENRLHLPQTVIDLCDYIVSQGDGSRNIQAAFPAEHIHFVRQYTTDIRLSYGREMVVDSWGDENPVYELMELPAVIDAEALSKALIEDECRFVVLHAARQIDGALEDYGYEKLVLLDGYYVYKNPEIPPA